MDPQFAQEWTEKIRRVRASSFWHQVSAPPAGNIARSREQPRTEAILRAEILQVEHLISHELPEWQERLLRWT